MEPTKEQIVHDLAMACVHGVVQNKVLQENKEEFSIGIVDAGDFVFDAVSAYKQAWDMIFPLIDVEDI